MAKRYGRVPIEWESSPAWRDLSPIAQWLHVKLSAGVKVSYCGVGDWWPVRLAKTAAGLTRDQVETAANELQAAGWLFIDDETQEFALRDYLVDQGVFDQVKLPAAAAREWTSISSSKIRGLVAHDFQKHVSLLKPSAINDLVSTVLAADVSEWEFGQADGQADAQADGGALNNLTYTLTPRGSEGSKETDPPRVDVERLCALLADLIEANGAKRPTVTNKWRTECRLLLDSDGRDAALVEDVMRWCQRDQFWKSNVMSMPKLRQKFDQLLLKSGLARRKVTDVSTEWMHG